MTLPFALLAGLAAGVVHVFAGPDHLAAVAPLGSWRGAWRVGIAWGVGHAFGVAILGTVAVLARGWLSPEWLSDVGERIVGATLIAIGIWGLARATGLWVRSDRHHHDDRAHAHPHLRLPAFFGPIGAPRHAHSHASLWIGILHGVAGGSHLLGFLPALAAPGGLVATGYVAGFAAGTIGGMAGFAALVGRLASGGRRPGTARAVLGGSSALAIAVGAVWLVA